MEVGLIIQGNQLCDFLESIICPLYHMPGISLFCRVRRGNLPLLTNALDTALASSIGEGKDERHIFPSPSKPNFHFAGLHPRAAKR
jgi:hypothetical protein